MFLRQTQPLLETGKHSSTANAIKAKTASA